MAIGARVSPELVVHGMVTGIRTSTWEGEDRGNRVTIDTDGGPLVVGFSVDQRPALPSPGSEIALVVSVYDGQRGSSLSYVRNLQSHDLDALALKAGLVPAGK